MLLTLRPPAKLNRFLHITGRRADGYHLLQTVFELIDWCDELEIESRDDRRIVLVGGTPGVAAEQDLAVRAARLMQTLHPGGCTLTLSKHIPTGAGMGGGSSDAAAVLLGLNRIWGVGLDRNALIELGLRLGSDVPVFLGQTPAFAEGVGEWLQPLPWVDRHYLVVHPGVALATATMFAATDLRRDAPPLTPGSYLAGAATTNVFEPVARSLSTEVELCFGWVGQYGHAQLTGSGSAVFCELADPGLGTAALARLPERWRGRVVRSLTNWFDKAEGRG